MGNALTVDGVLTNNGTVNVQNSGKSGADLHQHPRPHCQRLLQRDAHGQFGL
jgi:hypothetical protein